MIINVAELRPGPACILVSLGLGRRRIQGSVHVSLDVRVVLPDSARDSLVLLLVRVLGVLALHIGILKEVVNLLGVDDLVASAQIMLLLLRVELAVVIPHLALNDRLILEVLQAEVLLVCGSSMTRAIRVQILRILLRSIGETLHIHV